MVEGDNYIMLHFVVLPDPVRYFESGRRDLRYFDNYVIV